MGHEKKAVQAAMFEDSSRNWIGDRFDDPANGFRSFFSRSETFDKEGNVTGFSEVGSNIRYNPDNPSEIISSRSWEYNFDENFELVSGKESMKNIKRFIKLFLN